ncbi:four helix bundle protein [Larkinella punicea]|uniref:Four helix bundle protein n=1 Tax=Larkinella punicea TaxID=2315727 RepID=A0A368JXP6_9BACT|nr:four helix bundle protein [Larkinella punicea]RCR71403.1 four helix bundle protein [Larkinella punicea]
MSKIEKFEDLIVWREGLDLAISLYKELIDCQDYSLKDQMRRAAVSISSNIAEGFERHSNKEFIRYLRIAKGSTGELRTQIHLSIAIGVITNPVGEQLLGKTRLISAMLQNLIKTRLEKF